MRTVRAKLCILGGGPAALLCGAFLLEKGLDVTGIATSRYGMLSPRELDGIWFSPMPVFVDTQSALFSKLNREDNLLEDLLRVEYLGTPECGGNRIPRPDSIADFLMRFHNDPARAIGLARKHMGQLIDEQDAPELREKIRRHYFMGTLRGKRLGFHQGLSPYCHYLLKMPELAIMTDTVEKIDVINRYVAGRRNKVYYERLISTIPLGRFLTLSQVDKKLATDSGGAQFVFFRTDEHLNINLLIYDCDPMSEIYRLFVPIGGIIIVHVARQHWYASKAHLSQRVQTLLGLAKAPIWKDCVTLPDCYPLGVSDYALKSSLQAELEAHDVLLFGRFGEWEYRDLDELDWERCDEFATHQR